MRRRFEFASRFSFLVGAILLAALALSARSSTERLTAQNRLAILRELAYEYATVLQPLPATKEEEEALEVDPEGKIDEEKVRQQLANAGAAVETGDIVQVTGLEFKDDYILFEINGGGKKKQKWWERIRVGGGMGGGIPEVRTEPPPRPAGEPTRVTTGTWVRLAFPHLLPDMTPDEVKQMLAGVLDFSQESATKPWIETIPEKFRQAIEEHRAITGMNRKMVLAALGRPQNKVRETENGVETEDWIYGYPPMVTFVTFIGDEVVEVQEFK